MGFYAIVRGPLGVGKTSVARRLAAELDGEYVSIDAILDRYDLEEWEDGYISVGSFVRANEYAAEVARSAMQRGRPAVVDGNFYHRAAIEDLERRLPFPHEVFTLLAPLEECVRRDRERTPTYGATAVREVFTKVTDVDYGTNVDATRPIASLVRELAERSRNLGVAPRNQRPRRP